jgi:hypothetical protein
MNTALTTVQSGWRLSHLGRLLGESVRRFDARVLTLMAHNIEVPLALSNLAARGQVNAAHVHITRHVALEGSRLTDLAQAAGAVRSLGHCAAPARSPRCAGAVGVFYASRFAVAQSV